MQIKRWWFTISLLAVYLAVFEAWIVLPPQLINFSAVVATLLLAGVFATLQRQHYFLNRSDAFGHAAIIADIFVEGILIPNHADRSFYLCALAFAVVVGGFRWWSMRCGIPFQRMPMDDAHS